MQNSISGEQLDQSRPKNYNIKLPKDTKFAIGSFCEFLNNLSRILEGVVFSISLNFVNKTVFYSVRIPEEYSELMENQIYTMYPTVEIEETDYDLSSLSNPQGAVVQPVLKYSDFFPFLDFTKQEGSFISDILSHLTRLSEKDIFQLQIKIKPYDRDKIGFTLKRSVGLSFRAFKDRVNFMGPLFSKKLLPSIRLKAVEEAKEKNKKTLFLTEISLILISDSYSLAHSKLSPIAHTFKKLESEFNEFSFPSSQLNITSLQQLNSNIMSKRSMYMTAEEIGTVMHFPLETNTIPNLHKILASKAEPPLGLPTEQNTETTDLCLFAKTNYRNIREEFGIKRKDRARHMYIIGKSGSGKSKLLENLIKSDIENGQGFCAIDPHGDLIESIFPLIPESRIKDVIYFNATDEEFPISFNPIEKVPKMYRQQVAIGFIEIFKKTFGANWTPRLEHVLRMTILALLDTPKASVMSILLILSDRNYRQEVIKTIEDQVVKNFWTNEFAGWSEKFDNEAIMPILNKIGQFVSNPLIRNIVGQDENKVKMQDIMDNRKILLVKLPKGILGEENTSLLGSMIVTKIYQVSLARTEIPESQRVPFNFYIDEFQNFATDNFSDILSESRKYKLSLTIAHQHISQVKESVIRAIFGNVGTIISFRIGPEDAVVLEKEYAPKFTSNDLTNLAVRDIYIKMSIDDETKEAFSARVLPAKTPDTSFKENIVQLSRQNYCQQKNTAEREIQAEKSRELEVLEKLKNEAYSAPIL